jgi:SAM-dependent methyltransferase
MKDLFSGHAQAYATYRPNYPQELIQWLLQQVDGKEMAWDCATGNGQIASILSPYFTQVYATDLSTKQLEQAPKLPNIIYQKGTAENSGLPANAFDLVVVAQAVHWFQFQDFYNEVKRVTKPNAVLAIIGYGLMQVDAETDAIIQHLYSQTLGGYWDAERRYLDENYQTIPFPFTEIQAPSFTMQTQWTADQLIGYLQTWSAVKHYEEQNGNNPVEAIAPQLHSLWQQQTKTASFPLLLRVGKVHTY